MQREARANFHVIRINRWSLAVALAVGLGLLLWPLAQWVPVSGARPRRVQEGVTLLGRDLSGKSEAEVRALVEELAARLSTHPIDAQKVVRMEAGGQTAAGVIPELNGYQLNVEETVRRALAAAPQTEVAPAWVPVRASVTARELGLPIYSANPARPAVALLINVAWGTEHLPEILTTLKRHGAKATFLVTGYWAERNPELLRQIAADGHEVGNHGYDGDAQVSQLLQKGQLRADIARADAVIQQILGRKPTYYQPHEGWLDPKGEVVRTARSLGYTTVMWSRDTVDWRPGRTAAQVLQVIKEAKPGDIILMHPTRPTREALDEGLRSLKARGLTPMTLSEILSADHVPSSQPVRANH